LPTWTELDVWQYIEREGIETPEIYCAHEREVFRCGRTWLMAGAWAEPAEGESAKPPPGAVPHGGRHVLYDRDRHRGRHHRSRPQRPRPPTLRC
jgi:3'-phosphoadenosine 5'-phosphosulfate sulfotransferase (PAPS reductase)/FAD synthetase